MIVRLAELKDIPSLIHLLQVVCNHHADLLPDVFKHGGCRYTQSQLEHMIYDLNVNIFVVEVEGLVMGALFSTIKTRAESSTNKKSDYIYINDLCVDEGARGLGCGKALVDYVELYAKNINADTVELNCWCANLMAYGFYEHMGYEPQIVNFIKKMK